MREFSVQKAPSKTLLTMEHKYGIKYTDNKNAHSYNGRGVYDIWEDAIKRQSSIFGLSVMLYYTHKILKTQRLR